MAASDYVSNPSNYRLRFLGRPQMGSGHSRGWIQTSATGPIEESAFPPKVLNADSRLSAQFLL